jgi:5-methylcytosine-specific restriction protein A
MNIRNSIELVLTEYPVAKKQEFANHPLAALIRGEVPIVIRAEVEKPERYTFKGSAGQGNWSQAPWIAVFDILITNTAQRGYYPVYLFREDFSGLYLSLNQGVTDIKQMYPSPKEALKIKAVDYRTQIGGQSPRFPESNIDLRPSSPSNLSAFYEAGNICAKFYETNNLPSEEELITDLQSILQIYEILSYNETIPVGTATTEEETIYVEDLGKFRQHKRVERNATLAEDVKTKLYVEDLRKFRQHKRVERNATLAKEAKRIHGFTCKLCGFNFEQIYGEIGQEYIEAHHLTPISKLKGEKLLLDPAKDFTVLCANCHRMIHRFEFPDDIEGFRKKYLTGSVEQ